VFGNQDWEIGNQMWGGSRKSASGPSWWYYSRLRQSPNSLGSNFVPGTTLQMRTPHRPSITAALTVALALSACSAAPTGAMRTSPHPDPGVQAESAAVARARADSARYPYTEADVHFMSSMIGHHSQAIVMAGWAPTHGASASVRTLAERIVNAQQDEIATMQQWLGDRRQPVPEVGAGAMAMHGSGHGPEHGMLMPGMLTEAQMRQLDQARGPEFDREFLRFMIQHHRGAVSMVKDLFGSYGAAQDQVVFKFANDVNVDQSTEIARMERMLAALTPERKTP
jgi:uncharacterized protein (DUF305 family)